MIRKRKGNTGPRGHLPHSDLADRLLREQIPTRGEVLQKLTCRALRENPVMHHEVHEIRAL